MYHTYPHLFRLGNCYEKTKGYLPESPLRDSMKETIFTMNYEFLPSVSAAGVVGAGRPTTETGSIQKPPSSESTDFSEML